MVNYEISVTDEYERLVEMFIRHGLEFLTSLSSRIL